MKIAAFIFYIFLFVLFIFGCVGLISIIDERLSGLELVLSRGFIMLFENIYEQIQTQIIIPNLSELLSFFDIEYKAIFSDIFTVYYACNLGFSMLMLAPWRWGGRANPFGAVAALFERTPRLLRGPFLLIAVTLGFAGLFAISIVSAAAAAVFLLVLGAVAVFWVLSRTIIMGVIAGFGMALAAPILGQFILLILIILALMLLLVDPQAFLALAVGGPVLFLVSGTLSGMAEPIGDYVRAGRLKIGSRISAFARFFSGLILFIPVSMAAGMATAGMLLAADALWVLVILDLAL